MPPRTPTLFLESFSQVRRCLTGVVDATYGRLGLGATQARLLRTVGERRLISQANLARSTGTDPALTGRALETLLDRGWVQRRRSREDKRAFSLELTASGEVLLKQVLAAREAMAARVRVCLTDQDLAAFNRIAKKLLTGFPEQPSEGTSPSRSAAPSRKAPRRRLRPARS